MHWMICHYLSINILQNFQEPFMGINSLQLHRASGIPFYGTNPMQLKILYKFQNISLSINIIVCAIETCKQGGHNQHDPSVEKRKCTCYQGATAPNVQDFTTRSVNDTACSSQRSDKRTTWMFCQVPFNFEVPFSHSMVYPKIRVCITETFFACMLPFHGQNKLHLSC